MEKQRSVPVFLPAWCGSDVHVWYDDWEIPPGDSAAQCPFNLLTRLSVISLQQLITTKSEVTPWNPIAQ
jgi:hypothetical protein